MQDRDVQEQIERLTILIEELRAIGLPGAATCFERALKVLETSEQRAVEGGLSRFFPTADLMRIQSSLSRGTSRIPDDLKEHTLLSLDPRSVHLFREPRPFGDAVFDAFPAASGDIEEAAKCLALERGTACVFHIMRALESAAGVIAAKIGATVCDQHGKGLPWGIIADNMKPKIDAMIRGSSEQISWYRVQQDLVVINRAWRVPTSHPKESYSPEEAQEIFNATKAFMKELAPLA